MSNKNTIPSPDEITEQINEDKAILVDVRRDDEWKQAHAEPAVHLPYEDIINGATPTTETSKRLYLYCKSGGRAGAAAEALKSKGYDAISIGGLDGWVEGGGTTE